MRWWAILAGLALVACGDDEALRVSGEHGYVRCLALEPPSSRAWTVGSLRLALDERTLRIDGAPSDARIAVFTGPVDERSLRALDRPHLGLMLGGLGGTRAHAERSLGALAALGVPILFVAGGADSHAALEAFDKLEGEARDRVIDASRLRSIRIGKLELVSAAGAPGGRYALDDEACGLGEADVSAIAEAAGDPQDGVHRVLVSWAAPAGDPLSRGLMGTEAGSDLLNDLARRLEAQGWIAAWPQEHAGEVKTEPLRAVATPLTRHWIERADGTRRRPGAMLLTLSAGGRLTAARVP